MIVDTYDIDNTIGFGNETNILASYPSISTSIYKG